jgi:uncharacterized membrane protein YphA (DoxX/SURF4 family)
MGKDCGYNILRYFFGIAFVVAGLDKLLHFGMAKGMFEGLFGGLGSAVLVVAIILELGGGLMLLANKYVKESSVALGVLILVALVVTFKVGEADWIGTLREILVMNTGGGNTPVNLAYLAGLAALFAQASGCKDKKTC